jgi:hypothetical protein
MSHIKKFESFSSDLKEKSKKADHGVDDNDEVGKDLTLDQFRKAHKSVLSGEWDERDLDKEFDESQESLKKYLKLSDKEKQKYLDKLGFSDSTSL